MHELNVARVPCHAIPNITVSGIELDTMELQRWLQGSKHSDVVLSTINREMADL